MKITKFGHCCLLLEESGVRILIDPGSYSTGQNYILGVDAVLITHSHSDHLDFDSLKIVLHNNANVKIITNASVRTLLEQEGIRATVLTDGEQIEIKGLAVEVFGKEHAVLYHTVPAMENVGYLIGGRFFYPGDALTKPPKSVELLALPMAGPWLKLSDAIDYAIEIKPRVCFPVHDGILKQIGSTNAIPPDALRPHGIVFQVLELEKETTI